MADSDRERWDRRFAEGSHAGGSEPDWLEGIEELPTTGRALDVATGAGPVARWLARRGLQVTAVDISSVGLGLCRKAAQVQGLEIETLELDLEDDPLPAGPYVLISCFHYLQRELLSELFARLAPGGFWVSELATRRNLERHARPSARFLIEPNELLTLVHPLEVVYYREGWLAERNVARMVARKI